jgi:hypothetical protein
MNFDFPQSLRHAHRLVLVEVALHHPASVDGDLASHELTQSIDDRALNLIDCITRD